jgi:hypothetical protein
LGERRRERSNHDRYRDHVGRKNAVGSFNGAFANTPAHTKMVMAIPQEILDTKILTPLKADGSLCKRVKERYPFIQLAVREAKALSWRLGQRMAVSILLFSIERARHPRMAIPTARVVGAIALSS